MLVRELMPLIQLSLQDVGKMVLCSYRTGYLAVAETRFRENGFET